MIHMVNVMRGCELRDVQQVFDRIVAEPWFVRDLMYERELGAYMIHLYLNGAKESNVLYELCASAALRRYRASRAASARAPAS